MAQATDPPKRSRHDAFPAKFRSECAECDGSIEIGQMIRYSNRQARHLTCPDFDQYEFGLPQSACPRCFMVLLPSGSCPTCE